MSADARGFRNNPLQELFWTRTGLLLLILIVTSGVCLTVSSLMAPSPVHNFLVSLGTGTLISAVVSFGQTLVTATASQRALVAPLIEESRRALQELSAEYRSLDREFFPTHVFKATSEPDPAFNHLMMQDLHRTRQYFFRGFSGRHAAARLLLSHAEWELRAVVADPLDGQAISGRARYWLRHEGADGDYDSIQTRLHDETCIGLVGLYLARSRCSRVDVTVVSDPPLDRLEMFDDSVWLTLYSDPSGASALYPRTLRFSEGSFVYSKERAEFLRVSNSRTAHHYVITPDTARDEFMLLFEKITGSPLTEEGLRSLENKFHTFRREFTSSAELGS
ncbi:hypothetical protein F0L68_15235 [Solihabitans fulvus]|uniref:Uncharacterized protein n=1 Tax=Solihabitans fulvus TaxID=1892852 RepID=A0A5B2XFB4_9PSEU|nr:hypothetical protein [Solihabitans fulvus]KAA2261814.1 hypothetical protein F0L68_15235 [Solihabitans fulvus]